MPPTIDALIPARSGSKRITGKNFREIGGHPLLAYAIVAAKQAGIFRRVIVSIDSVRGGDIATKYGAETHFRKPEAATDTATDLDWVSNCLEAVNPQADYIAILRPTAPFRQPETIRLAWRTMQAHPYATGLKAVSPVSEHPGKMWVIREMPTWNRLSTGRRENSRPMSDRRNPSRPYGSRTLLSISL